MPIKKKILRRNKKYSKFIMNIKRFNESVEPEIGDYIIVNLKNSTIGELLSNSIGKIVEYNNKIYKVKYGTTNWTVYRNEIEEFSKNKEDLEPFIAAKKYNL
jgi:hypothetical protein